MVFKYVLDGKDGTSLEKTYGITIDDIIEIERGRTNSNHLVSTLTGNKYVLRIYPEEKTREAILFEQEVLDELKSKNFQVPEIISKKEGGYVSLIGGHLSILSEFMPGEIIEPGDYNVEQLRTVGNHQARFHNILEYFESNFQKTNSTFGHYKNSLDRFSYESHIRKKILSKAIDEEVMEPQNVAEISEEFKYLKNKITKEKFDLTPKGIIHGDMYSHNILFTPDGSLSAIIDFDDCRIDTYCLDIGVTLLDLAMSNNALNLEKTKEHIQAYNPERKLSSIEKDMLPDYTRLYSLFLIINVLDTALKYDEEELKRLDVDVNTYFKRMQNIRDISVEDWNEILNN